jgi:hypothetical protein
MVLFANGWPVDGSVTVIGRPSPSTVCEKSPLRSSSVGMRCDAVVALSSVVR